MHKYITIYQYYYVLSHATISYFIFYLLLLFNILNWSYLKTLIYIYTTQSVNPVMPVITNMKKNSKKGDNTSKDLKKGDEKNYKKGNL